MSEQRKETNATHPAATVNLPQTSQPLLVWMHTDDMHRGIEVKTKMSDLCTECAVGPNVLETVR